MRVSRCEACRYGCHFECQRGFVGVRSLLDPGEVVVCVCCGESSFSAEVGVSR